MTALAPTPVDSTAPSTAPTFGRLVNTEFRRLAARRFNHVLLASSAIGYLLAVIFLWQSHAKVTDADIAQATAQRDAQIQVFKAQTAECLTQPGQTADTCGGYPTADQFPIDQFLQNQPFTTRDVSPYTMAVGGFVAMVAFIMAATFIGAEWSSKNIVAWLFWEPRRMRLMAAKLLALTTVLVVLSAIAQLIWGLTARLLLTSRGAGLLGLNAADAAGFWPDITQTQLRAGLLVIPVGLLGFALANLIRNTAAALGIAFVYFAVAESLIRALSPHFQPYLFTVNVAAWITNGGVTVFGDPIFSKLDGGLMPEEIHVSSAHGGAWLLGYAVVALVISLGLFRRRDIS